MLTANRAGLPRVSSATRALGSIMRSRIVALLISRACRFVEAVRCGSASWRPVRKARNNTHISSERGFRGGSRWRRREYRIALCIWLPLSDLQWRVVDGLRQLERTPFRALRKVPHVFSGSRQVQTSRICVSPNPAKSANAWLACHPYRTTMTVVYARSIEQTCA